MSPTSLKLRRINRKRWKLDLSRAQVQKLSDLVGDAAQVVLASIVIPAIFDKGNPIVIVSGLIATTICWIYALWVLKEIK